MPDTFDRLKAALADRYAIERELGSGGMATVYLAEDLKHERKVAVKVLRPDLAAALGSERFLREIKIAAQLHHPHILPLHDSGEADGFLYYVMPYEEGQSLREKLEKEGELPVTEAVRLLRDVVDALAHAHKQGVVHRDIKPDNVMLSGRHALVTDFGVAKAVSEATGRQQLTTAGVALGTPAYMAPEQAVAEPHIDHRADIYAVGALAYELLTGRPPFTGRTAQAVLSAHVTETAEPVTKYRETVPPALAQLVMRCLEKKPADRWQSAEELLPQLEALATPSGGITPTDTRPLPAARSSRGQRLVLGGAAAIVVAATGLLVVLPGDERPVVRPGAMAHLTLAQELELDPAIRPDGDFVAYAAGPAGEMRIYVRQVGGESVVPVTEGFDGHHRAPHWSPDGRRIAFQSGGSIYVVDAFGGNPRLTVEPPAGQAVFSPAWSPDGERIAYVLGTAGALRSDRAVAVQPVDGGDATELARGFDLHSVAWSPDGSRLAYVSGAALFTFGVQDLGNVDPSSIWIVPADGGAPVRVTDNEFMNISPTWLLGGEVLLYISNREGSRDVYQIRLEREGRPAGEPARITTGFDAQTISTSANGELLAYSVFVHRANLWSLDMPVSGPVSITAAQPLTTANQIIEGADVSPDGTMLVFDSNRDGNQELYKMPLAGGEPQRLTTEPADDYSPAWSPDGTEIAFHTLRNGHRDIYVMAADGRSPRRVTTDEAQDTGADWAPDGDRLLFTSDRDGLFGLYILSRDSNGRWGSPQRVAQHVRGGDPLWSPDGREILLVTEADSRRSVDVLDVASGETRALIEPGAWEFTPRVAAWSTDGRAVYVMADDVEARSSLWTIPAVGGQSRLLVRFDGPAKESALRFTHDGKRFYFTINEYESDIWVMELLTK